MLAEAGERSGGDLVGVIVFDYERPTTAQHLGQLVDALGRRTHTGRILRAGLEEHEYRIVRQRGPERSSGDTVRVKVEWNNLRAQLFEEVEKRRKRRVLDRYAIAEANK